MDYKTLDKIIDKKEDRFKEISDEIWCYAEPAYKEFKSAKLQEEFLKAEGFNIESGLAGIETAFKASYGSGEPVIGLLGEFDALPGLSQEADSLEESEGNEYGHGCGHNLLGVACMQSAVGIKDFMKENDLPGTIIYYGCPAEEGGAGKAFMVRENVFDEADVCLAWHPAPITAGSTSTLANARVYYNFKGVSAHAAAAPHLGRSALDSVELMNVGVNYLREHMIPEARIHYAVTDTGGNAPNVVQANAQVLYSVRAPSNDEMYDLLQRVNRIAEGAAMMCGTEVEIQVVSAYADIIQNNTLDNLAFKHIKDIYPLEYTEEEIEYAQKYFELGDKTEIMTYKNMAKKFLGDRGEDLFNGPLSDGIFPPNGLKVGSSDVGDVSWIVPTSWFIGNTWALGTGPHTWLAVAQGKSNIAHKGMKAAARVMSRCAIDILKDPTIADRAKADLNKTLNGREYKTVIPKDIQPGMIK